MKILTITHLVVSVLLTISILLQSRGSGLGSVFGGGMESYYTRRGLEKFLSNSSVILAILFVGLAIANFIFS